MSAEAALLTRTWKVGIRDVTMTIPRPRAGQPVHVACEWAPSAPQRLSGAEWRQYRAGRDAALRDLCAELGLRGGLVVEV